MNTLSNGEIGPNRTAPVRISGERGLFRKSNVKSGLKNNLDTEMGI